MLDEKTDVLARAAKRGDPEAFKQLCGLMKDKLYYAAAIFLGLKNGGFHPEDEILSAISKTVYKAYCGMRKQRFTLMTDTWLLSILCDICGENKTAQTEESDSLIAKICTFDAATKKAVVYRYVCGLDLTQTADAMGIRPETADNLLKASYAVIKEKELAKITQLMPPISDKFEETVSAAVDNADKARKKETKRLTITFFILIVITALIVAIFIKNLESIDNFMDKNASYGHTNNTLPTFQGSTTDGETE